MIRALLIANRGEIACRIIRTARRMGIATIAVYSDADAAALHVRAADRAIRIGPAPARQSYLDAAAIVAAAHRTGADAVHPGYGFLAENADFAEAVTTAGLVFVGPPAEAIRAMGSKAAAKALMHQAGVPLLPGYHGEDQDDARLAAEAARIGLPLVIKAVSGGGGRGMRVVRGRADFAPALAEARQEARAAFGDDRVLLERYLDRPRHIEVQVFADTHGTIVHLFERDCSTQRRHQKLIEEAPAPGLDATTRVAMAEAAVACARAVAYLGAGTVEFVSDGTEFFFLEMNTRLQVEHPVTEAVTGFDLVEWQLRIAAGEPLPATGPAIRLAGHAIEARLYAEDPARDFAPDSGRLVEFRLPDAARVETGFAPGDAVGVHYDALLAKLVVHGPTREAARLLLARALADCAVAGVATNLDLLSAIVAHPVFAAGAPDTGFVERERTALLHAAPATPDILAAAVLALLLEAREAAAARAAAAPDPASPWHAADGWWPNLDAWREVTLIEGETAHRLAWRGAGAGWRLRVGGQAMAGEAARAPDGRIAIVLDGVREHLVATHQTGRLALRLRGRSWRFGLPGDEASAEAAEAGDRLVAPIPGLVTEVMASPGAAASRGTVLVVLEAMKTVFRLAAPADAVIAEVPVSAGETVAEGQVLVRFAGADPAATPD